MAKKCSVNGCNFKYYAKGVCKKHYMQSYRRLHKTILFRDNIKEHYSYSSMVCRCKYTTHKQYKDYGGRGIKVCNRWLGPDGFQHFYEDMGPRPDGCTLDRIDVNGNYCPENCRWTNNKEQARNRRHNFMRYITIDGRTHCVSEWAEIVGVPPYQIFNRLRYGWDEKTAVMKPKMK